MQRDVKFVKKSKAHDSLAICCVYNHKKTIIKTAITSCYCGFNGGDDRYQEIRVDLSDALVFIPVVNRITCLPIVID